jgi:hypothetical protein
VVLPTDISAIASQALVRQLGCRTREGVLGNLLSGIAGGITWELGPLWTQQSRHLPVVAIRKLSRNGVRGDRSQNSTPSDLISSKRTSRVFRKISACKQGVMRMKGGQLFVMQRHYRVNEHRTGRRNEGCQRRNYLSAGQPRPQTYADRAATRQTAGSSSSSSIH